MLVGMLESTVSDERDVLDAQVGCDGSYSIVCESCPWSGNTILSMTTMLTCCVWVRSGVGVSSGDAFHGKEH